MRLARSSVFALAASACGAPIAEHRPVGRDEGRTSPARVGASNASAHAPSTLDDVASCEPYTFQLRGQIAGVSVDEALHAPCGGFHQVGPGGALLISLECSDLRRWPAPAPYAIELRWSGQVRSRQIAAIESGSIITEMHQPHAGVPLRSGQGTILAYGYPDVRFIVRGMSRADTGASVDGELYGCWRWE